MLKYFIAFLTTFIFSVHLQAQYHGLRFSGHETILDQRTGLDLAPEKPLTVRNDIELSFDFKLQPNQYTYFGYIFRVLFGDNNIDLLYLMRLPGENNLQMVIGKEFSKISLHLPLDLLSSDWVNFRIKFNFSEQKLQLIVNDSIYQDELKKFSETNNFKLFFGAHSCEHFSTTDVPSMNIRDIKIYDNKKLRYHWPLDQIDGNQANEIKEGTNGIVNNPNWLLKLHYFWDNPLKLKIDGLAQVAFNPEENLLYIVTDDSLYTINASDSRIEKLAYRKPHKVVTTSSILYDTVLNQLLAYSIDQGYMSIFDFEKLAWTKEPIDTIRFTWYWHHNRFLSHDGSLHTFGGYGQYKYKNEVLKFNELQKKWDTVSLKGRISPRYLAGIGYSNQDSLWYIVGGYGSETGDQVAYPDYFYDIHTISITDKNIEKVFEFENLNQGFCFSNSIYIDEQEGAIYGLSYPKFQFESKLQLIKIPLKNPEIIELGSKIDYKFLDVKSYSDLFYSSHDNKLIAVTIYTEENKTDLNIYSISFPPQRAVSTSEGPEAKPVKIKITIIILVILFLIFSGYYGYISRKKAKQSRIRSIHDNKIISNLINSEKIELHEVKPNSIILFGGFQVIDKDRNDITSLFTPKIKKLLLFIMLHSIRNNKGVSSNKLNETFWFDKSEESARNNRAVNILRLRTILEAVGKTDISKETGYWKLEFDPAQIYIDYYDYLQLVSRKKDLSKEQIIHLLKIVERGAFLANTEEDWLDPFKSEISNDIIDTLLGYINRNEDDPDFILELANCIFYFDIASEEAMIIKCKVLANLKKHSLARQTFEIFIKEYENLYGEKYDKSFKEIIS